MANDGLVLAALTESVQQAGVELEQFEVAVAGPRDRRPAPVASVGVDHPVVGDDAILQPQFLTGVQERCAALRDAEERTGEEEAEAIQSLIGGLIGGLID